MDFMSFSALLTSEKLFDLVEVPRFIWMVAVVLLVLTFGQLTQLWWLVHRERRLYQRLTRGLRALRSEYSPVLRDGLPQAACDTMAQLFERTALGSIWDGFAAQLVVQRDTTGADRVWTSESAKAVFNESSVLDARLNRDFFTAIPGMVTGVGLLCTFVAILVALLHVKLGLDHGIGHLASMSRRNIRDSPSLQVETTRRPRHPQPS